MWATWVFTVCSLTTSSRGDLGVRQAARDEPQHLELARRQLVERAAAPAGAARRANSLDQAAGDRGASSESPAATTRIAVEQLAARARP